jgi:hypothetical protein
MLAGKFQTAQQGTMVASLLQRQKNGEAELFLLRLSGARDLAGAQTYLVLDIANCIGRDSNEFHSYTDAREAISHFAAGTDLSPRKSQTKF